MPALEELIQQRREIIQRKYELHTYLMESRKIQGDINGVIYHHNSGVLNDGYFQIKESLEKELKAKNAELRRNHKVSPQRVEGKIREYDKAIEIIDKQLHELETQGMAQTQPYPEFDALYETPKQQDAGRQPQERSRDDGRDR